MIKLYVQDINHFGDPKKDLELLDNIPKRKVDKILRFIKAEDRKRSLGSWRVVEKIFQHNQLKTEDLFYTQNGKPITKDVNFNISHSGDFILGVSSDKEVGCDIEKILDPPFKIMERIFSEKEIKRVKESKSYDDRVRNFYKIWTGKESFLKMTGEGLIKNLRSIEIDLDTCKVKRDGKLCSCSLKFMNFNNYQACICISNHQ